MKSRLTTHNCDARCIYAIGDTCSCRCNGANHRRGTIETLTDAEADALILKANHGELSFASLNDALTDEDGNDLAPIIARHATFRPTIPAARRSADKYALDAYQQVLF